MVFIRIRLKKQALLAAAGVLGACVLAVLGIWLVHHAARLAAANPADSPDPVILLDAGHGGEDGGTVVDGVVEKDLNLAITLKLERYLRAMGYQTILTRTQDIAIHDDGIPTVRERKISDIHNRFTMMEGLREQDLFISIHQNQYPGRSAHGTQVFYSTNTPASAVLAESIQKSVVRLVQPSNTRLIKPSTDSIYLLYHAKKTAVLVECGFLSNPEEAARLQQDDYQNQIAFAIAAGVLDFRR